MVKNESGECENSFLWSVEMNYNLKVSEEEFFLTQEKYKTSIFLEFLQRGSIAIIGINGLRLECREYMGLITENEQNCLSN